MLKTSDALRKAGKRIAVVPTMGFLHEGHLSLIRIARQHADVAITTIFVNPTQFAPTEDFTKYPRDLDRDKRLAQSAGTDILFVPDEQEMYPRQYRTFVDVEKTTEVLEGKFRPTHFRGVATVVAKLFNITKPHLAVFGQKDAQQAVVIGQMVKDLNVDIEVVIAPIVREPDGLAMSSRNVYLSPTEREDAVVLSQSLRQAERLIAGGERSCATVVSEMKKMISAKQSAVIDYISIAESTTLEESSLLKKDNRVLVSLAVRIGRTRLIDNTIVTI